MSKQKLLQVYVDLFWYTLYQTNATLCCVVPLLTFFHCLLLSIFLYSVSSSSIACSCKHRRISAPKASAVSCGNRGRIQVGFKLKRPNMLTPNESRQENEKMYFTCFYCTLLNHYTRLAWTGCSVFVSILADFALVHIFRNPSPFPAAPSAQRVPEAVDQQNGASTTCLAKWIGCK